MSRAGSATAIVRGRVITLAGPPEPARVGLRDVQGLATRDGRIVASGSVDEVEATATAATIRIDLAPNEIAMPALTDGHLHLADAAVAARELRLESAATLDDGLAAIAGAAGTLRGPGEWLRGGGWDAGRWGRWPTAADLERVVPGRPVLLWSHDLHSVWCSGEAFRRSGVTAATPDPAGGVVRRLNDGTPAGVLHEDATQLVTAHAPVPTIDELADLIVAYGRRLLSLGVVAVHDPSELEMDSRLERGFAAIERLAGSGLLPIRVHAGLRRGALDRAIERGLRSGDPLGPAGGRARVGWLKLFADGTLGSRTAALLDDYSLDPELGEPPAGPRGLLVTDPVEMRELAERAAAHGIATSIHAIGDRALRHALDALEPTPGALPFALESSMSSSWTTPTWLASAGQESPLRSSRPIFGATPPRLDVHGVNGSIAATPGGRCSTLGPESVSGPMRRPPTTIRGRRSRWRRPAGIRPGTRPRNRMSRRTG